MGLPRLTGRAFRDLAAYMTGFGLVVGVVFPYAVMVLGVPGTYALRPGFRVACVVAGLLVGAVNFALARLAVGVRLSRLVVAMAEAAATLRGAADTGSVGRYSTAVLPVDSADELGRAAAAYNDLLREVERSQRIENTVTVLTAATIGSLDVAGLSGRALDAACEHPAVTGGVVGPPGGTAADAWSVRGLRADQVDAVFAADLAPGVGLLPPGPGGGTFAVFRLTDVGRVIGVLGLALSAPPDAAGNRILRVLADHLSVALANARLHEQMTVLARIDDLTGIENRRAGMACLEDEILRSVHTGQPLGLLLLDLDHFKAVNDTYGHRVGDRVLVHVTRVCRAALRPADTLARYGGEELVAILPGADVDAVTVIAERLRRDVAATPARRPEGDAVGVTLTAGGISWTPTVAATDTDALLTAADLALYAGKSDGRNRSVIRSFPPSSDDPVTVSRADAGSA
ncbi:MAG: hypothetical protein QOC93_3891 [Actinomycetota bacterium]|nr:putative diguanylate cyclase with sensor domain [Cryptosporangiaceae bacterium]MDQ1678747.1 hypothetical protein [Actinomycetota bacterium]